MADEKQPTNSAEESTAETTDAASTSQSESSGEDFAGYSSLDEMRNAVYASRKEGKRLAEQNAQLAGYLARVVKTSEAKETSSGAEELSELGIPVEALQRVVREAVQAEMAPMGRTQEAINTVRATHPGFAKSEADFNRWLGANPDVVSTYNQSVAESPRAAEYLLKGVFAEYESSRHVDPGTQQKKVPADAKIPASRGGGSARRDAPEKIGREEMKELVKDARRNGNPVEIMRAILGDKPIHRDIERQRR